VVSLPEVDGLLRAAFEHRFGPTKPSLLDSLVS
jgi:hypothetical protein